MTKADAKRREERVKLLATALANLGTASIVAGFVAPVFGGRLEPYSLWLGLVFGFGFHVGAQAMIHLVVVDDPSETG